MDRHYLRNENLSKNIFDYTKGLKLHKELENNGNTIKAGIFIGNSDSPDLNLGQLHQNLMNNVIPFSWFIAENYLDERQVINHIHPNNTEHEQNLDQNKIRTIDGVLDGNATCIGRLIDGIRNSTNDDFPEDFPILPKHVLNLKFIVGPSFNDNDILNNG